MEKTIENLTRAFVGESMARNRYAFYAKIAKEEGYEQIAAIFVETAEQEKTHAKRLFEHVIKLKKEAGEIMDEIKIDTSVPIIYGSTIENLKAAVSGENFEHTSMYPEFAENAKEEGLEKIFVRFLAIAKAEEHHEERFKKLLESLESGETFEKGVDTSWACRECGYIYTGKEAPKICPSCDHPQAYYQVKSENY